MRDTDIKYIYNTYLRVSRKRQNKPFKLRQNWDGFESNENYLPLIKLKNFFDRNYIVNIEDYFNAPYEVYPEDTFYDLHYYNTLSAIKVYNIFCNIKNNLNPDSELQIENVVRGLKFIKQFCINKNILLGDYLFYKESGATINAFVVHIKEKHITFYNLFPFKDFDKVYSNIDPYALKFILNDIYGKISIFRSKFYGSKNCKQIASQGLKLIEQALTKKQLD